MHSGLQRGLSVVITVPAVAFFIVLQRYLIQGGAPVA